MAEGDFESVHEKQKANAPLPMDGILYMPVPDPQNTGAYLDRHATLASLEQTLREQMRQTLGAVGTWDVTGFEQPLYAVEEDSESVTITDTGSGAQTMSFASTLTPLGDGSNYYGAATRGEPILKSGTDWARVRIPSIASEDNTVVLVLALVPLGDSLSALVDKTGSSNNVDPGDGTYVVTVQINLLSSPHQVMYQGTDDGEDSGTPAPLTLPNGDPVAGDDVYLGIDFSSNRVLVKKNDGSTVEATTLSEGFQDHEYQLHAGLMFSAETPSFSAGSVEFDLGSEDISGDNPFTIVDDPTLPEDAVDHKRYQITGQAPFAGKQLYDGDVVEFINDTSDVLVTRLITESDFAKLAKVPEHTQRLDLLRSDLDTFQTEQTRTPKSVIEIEGQIYDSGSDLGLDSENDGTVVIGIGAPSGVSGEAADAGVTAGDVVRVTRTAYREFTYEIIDVPIGQTIAWSYATGDVDVVEGPTNFTSVWYRIDINVSELVDAFKRVVRHSSWQNMVEVGWAPDPFLVTLQNKENPVVTTVDSPSTDTSAIDPNADWTVFVNVGATVNVDNEHTVGLDTIGNNGKAGYFVIQDIQDITLVLQGGPRLEFTHGVSATVLGRWRITPGGNRVIHVDSVMTTGNGQPNMIFDTQVADGGTVKCPDGFDFTCIANDGQSISSLTVELPAVQNRPGFGYTQQSVFELVFEDFDVSNLSIVRPDNLSETVGKTLPTSVSAGDVLRFKYLPPKLIYLGKL